MTTTHPSDFFHEREDFAHNHLEERYYRSLLEPAKILEQGRAGWAVCFPEKAQALETWLAEVRG